MATILNVYKPQGLTPLQTINLLREKLTEYKDKTIGFAGRLDPLAHGVLLLMIDKETTKQKDKFLNLDKEYEFEAVFGVSTDTYDSLGLIDNAVIKQFNNDLQKAKSEIEAFIKSKLGKQIQPYPPYSSKTVLGKPLYQWAREGKLSEVDVPAREIEIYSFTTLGINTITTEKLKEKIFKQINSVTGDFRQEKIKIAWNIFFTNNQRPKTNNQFLTARFNITCSSGTYIRSLVHELGKKTNMEAIALEILRTKVGKYDLKDSLQLI